MGVLNVSPESFYRESVHLSDRQIAREAVRLTEEGADLIDVGAMSTAPYLKTEISEKEEARRLARAVQLIRQHSNLPISIDTARIRPAEAGLAAGATIINDVTGLRREPALARVAVHAKGLILMAHPFGATERTLKNPVTAVKARFQESLHRALRAGVPRHRLVLDPGIGFFRCAPIPWWQWDVTVLKNLRTFLSLGCPLLVGVSRKSFIGHLLGGVPAEDRLAGSLVATAFALENGADILRTHDVKMTKQAVQMTRFLFPQKTARFRVKK